jgi:hypothetical protein
MPASQARSRSPWQRTRYWTTFACLVAVAAGLLTLAAGHPMHGWLMILGGLMLVRGTVFGKRGRRIRLHAHGPGHGQTAAIGSNNNSRKWRKAA